MGFFDLITGEDKQWWAVILFWIIFVVGVWNILMCILSPMVKCSKHCCRYRQRLNDKYGRKDNSAYAVVTGGSDGIGLELCNQLAEHGFNICMISRNKSKVDAKLAEIKVKYPNTETIGIECDFSKHSTLAAYRDLVKESGLGNLDIGVLCLNAGISSPWPIDVIDDQRYQDSWNVNALHVVYLMKALAN